MRKNFCRNWLDILAETLRIKKSRPLILVWVIFLFYSAIAAAFIQFLVLPGFFPALHGKLGLLAKSDALGYHDLAAVAAERLRASNWREWEFAPQGQTAAGLAAPFYAIFGPWPSVLIPINAFLHASTGAVVVLLLRKMGVEWRFAVVGAGLWIAMPSSLQWVAQIQKDGYYFAGMLLTFLVWTSCLEAAALQKNSFATLAKSGFMLMIAILAVGLSRPYGLLFILAGSSVVATIAVIFTIKNSHFFSKRLVLKLLLPLLIAAPLFFSPILPSDNRLQAELPKVNTANISGRYEAETIIMRRWQNSDWMPEFLEKKLLQLVIARQGFAMEPYLSAGSSIDLDVKLSSINDLIKYIPRAMQIAVLAPFPSQWMEQGQSNGGGLMRRIAGYEMTIVYISIFIGFPIAMLMWWNRYSFWLINGLCFFIITIYAYAVPNIGTLYRLRYGFLMIIVATGISGILTFIANQRSQQQGMPSL